MHNATTTNSMTSTRVHDDTLIRTAPDNTEAVRVFADFCAESAYCWDH